MNAGEQISLSDLGLWSSKMSQEYSAPTMEKTSELCLRRPQELSTPMSLFLDLRTDWVGVMLGASWQTDGLWFGRFTTQSIGGFPKDAKESHLSQILEDNPHPKYSLSPKACQGILNRAEKRGKELPKILKDALMQSVSRNEQDVVGGKGILIQSEKCGAIGTLNTQAICNVHRGGKQTKQ